MLELDLRELYVFCNKERIKNYKAKYRKSEICDDCLAINHCHQKYLNGNNHTNTILCSIHKHEIEPNSETATSFLFLQKLY